MSLLWLHCCLVPADLYRANNMGRARLICTMFARDVCSGPSIRMQFLEPFGNTIIIHPNTAVMGELIQIYGTPCQQATARVAE